MNKGKQSRESSPTELQSLQKIAGHRKQYRSEDLEEKQERLTKNIQNAAFSAKKNQELNKIVRKNK